MNIQEKFKEIVSVLQNELEEYGGLLHLFDRQQKCIIHQDPAGFLDINVDVDEQIAKLSQCRQSREELPPLHQPRCSPQVRVQSPAGT